MFTEGLGVDAGELAQSTAILVLILRVGWKSVFRGWCSDSMLLVVQAILGRLLYGEVIIG